MSGLNPNPSPHQSSRHSHPHPSFQARKRRRRSSASSSSTTFSAYNALSLVEPVKYHPSQTRTVVKPLSSSSSACPSITRLRVTTDTNANVMKTPDKPSPALDQTTGDVTPLVVSKADLRAAKKDLGMSVTPTPRTSRTTTKVTTHSNTNSSPHTTPVFLDGPAAEAARQLLSSTRRHRQREWGENGTEDDVNDNDATERRNVGDDMLLDMGLGGGGAHFNNDRNPAGREQIHHIQNKQSNNIIQHPRQLEEQEQHLPFAAFPRLHLPAHDHAPAAKAGSKGAWTDAVDNVPDMFGMDRRTMRTDPNPSERRRDNDNSNELPGANVRGVEYPKGNGNPDVNVMTVMMTPMVTKRRLSTGSAVTPLALNFESPPTNDKSPSTGSSHAGIDKRGATTTKITTVANGNGDGNGNGVGSNMNTPRATLSHVQRRHALQMSRPFAPSPTTPATTKAKMNALAEANGDMNGNDTALDVAATTTTMPRHVSVRGSTMTDTHTRTHTHNDNSPLASSPSIRPSQNRRGASRDDITGDNDITNANANLNATENLKKSEMGMGIGVTLPEQFTTGRVHPIPMAISPLPPPPEAFGGGGGVPQPLFTTGKGVAIPVPLPKDDEWTRPLFTNGRGDPVPVPVPMPGPVPVPAAANVTNSRPNAVGFGQGATSMFTSGKGTFIPIPALHADRVQRTLFDTGFTDGGRAGDHEAAPGPQTETPLLAIRKGNAAKVRSVMREGSAGRDHEIQPVQKSLFTTGHGKSIAVKESALRQAEGITTGNGNREGGPQQGQGMVQPQMPMMFTTGKGKTLNIDPSKGHAILFGDGTGNGKGLLNAKSGPGEQQANMLHIGAGGASTSNKRKRNVGFMINDEDNKNVVEGMRDLNDTDPTRKDSAIDAKRLFQTPSTLLKRPERRRALMTPSSSGCRSILRNGKVRSDTSGSGMTGIARGVGAGRTTEERMVVMHGGVTNSGAGGGHLLKGLTTPTTDGLRKTLFRDNSGTNSGKRTRSGGGGMSSTASRRRHGGISNTPFKRPRMISPTNANGRPTSTATGVNVNSKSPTAKRKIPRVKVPQLLRGSGRITCCASDDSEKSIDEEDADGQKQGEEASVEGNKHQLQHVCPIDFDLSYDDDQVIKRLYNSPGCLWRCLNYSFDRHRFGRVSCLPGRIARNATLWGGEVFSVNQVIAWVCGETMFSTLPPPSTPTPASTPASNKKGKGNGKVRAKGATSVGSVAWAKLSYALAVNKLARLHDQLGGSIIDGDEDHGNENECNNTSTIVEVFTAANVVREIVRRVEYEWHRSKQMSLLRMLRRDTNPASHVVFRLVDMAYVDESGGVGVADGDTNGGTVGAGVTTTVSPSSTLRPPRTLELTVSDGWYIARLRPCDERLRKRIMTGWLKLGDPFHMCGASLVSCGGGGIDKGQGNGIVSIGNRHFSVFGEGDGDELDMARFQVNKNHVFRCRNITSSSSNNHREKGMHPRLGLRRMMAVRSVNAVCENGGGIQLMSFVVVRAYRPVYMEHVHDEEGSGNGGERKQIVWRRQDDELRAREAVARARHDRMAERVERRQKRQTAKEKKRNRRTKKSTNPMTRHGQGEEDDDDNDDDSEEEQEQERNVTCVLELKVCGVEDWQNGKGLAPSDVRVLRVYRSSDELSELVLRHDARGKGGGLGGRHVESTVSRSNNKNRAGVRIRDKQETGRKALVLHIGHVSPRRHAWTCRGDGIVSDIVSFPCVSPSPNYPSELFTPSLKTIAELMGLSMDSKLNKNNEAESASPYPPPQQQQPEEVDFDGVFYVLLVHRNREKEHGGGFLYVSDDGANVLAVELWHGDTQLHDRVKPLDVVALTDVSWCGYNQSLHLSHARATARTGFVFGGQDKKRRQQQRVFVGGKMHDLAVKVKSEEGTRAQLQLMKDATERFVDGKTASMPVFSPPSLTGPSSRKAGV